MRQNLLTSLAGTLNLRSIAGIRVHPEMNFKATVDYTPVIEAVQKAELDPDTTPAVQ